MSRPARWLLVVVLLLFTWMMLAGWETDPPRTRAFSATAAALMLLLGAGLAAPRRLVVALRIVAGAIALLYLAYFVVEVVRLLRGEAQPFRLGEPSALMAGLGLLVFGVPAIVFALGGERVGLARVFDRRASREDDERDAGDPPP